MKHLLSKEQSEIRSLQKQLAESNKAYETKISQLEHMLQDLQNFAGIGWWSYDLESRQIFWSPEIYRQYGWVGQEKAPELEEFIEMVFPDDKKKLKSTLDNALKFGNDLFEIRVAIGQEQLKYIKGDVKAIYNDEKKVVALHGTSMDITDIREAENKLKLEKENYRLITENVRDLICMHQLDGTISYLSPSIYQTLGYTPEELSGTNPYELLHPDDVSKIKEGPHQASLNGKVADNMEYRLKHKDGNYIWMQASFTPVIVNNKLVSIQSVSREITQQKLAQEKIEASERNYRRLAANIPNTDIYLLDGDKQIVLAEGANISQAGLSSESFEGKALKDSLGEELAAVIDPIYDKILEGEAIKQDLLFNGRQFNLNGVPVRDDNGHVDGILMVSTDITERKQAEEAVLKTKEELEDAQEMAKMGTLEVDVASDKISISPQFKKLLKLPENLNLDIRKGLSFFTKSSKQEFHLTILEAIKEGRNFDIELEIFDGSYEKKWVRVLGSTLTRNKKAHKIKCVFQDITLEKQAKLNVQHFQHGLRMLNAIASRSKLNYKEQIQRALKEVTNYLGMSLGVVCKVEREQTKVIHAVRTEVGLPDLSGHSSPVGELICALPFIQQKIVDITNIGISSHSESKCCKLYGLNSFVGAPLYIDGQIYGTVSFSSQNPKRAFTDEDKEFVRILARWIGATLERSLREQEIISARRQAEKASMAKAEFLSSMSHEIRTPLNAVIGITHLLMEDNPRPDQVDNLKALRFSGENLMALINDILDFSKIEAGKIEFEDVDFNLKEFTNGLKQSLGFKAKEKGIDFNVHLDDKLPTVTVGDTTRLSQILNNLISNAIKFTERGGVSLSISEQSRSSNTIEILFQVKDSGIGIAPEQQQKIFESFSQASTETTRKYGGTGLGLTITKKLLELQGSQIQLQSKVGEGSTFGFVLKLKIGNEQFENKHNSDQDKNVNLNSLEGYKVLLVEDNAMNVIVARQFLNRWKLTFDHAENGQEAVYKVRENHYDLVLMDLQMPVMDGYEATQLIRQTHSDLPIIALTASAMLEIQEKVYKVGMNDFATKPFNPQELKLKISKHLLQSSLEH